MRTKVLAFLTAFYVSPSSLLGQQNLFNIPSGAITPSGEFFYQHQVNFYGPSSLASKQHVVYGLGKGWDAGVNLVGLKFADKGPDARFELQTNAIDQYRQLKPALLATGQKQWRVDGHWAVNVGAQAGINVSDRLSYKQLLAFGYGLVVYTHHHNRISLGPYVGNRNYLGLGNEVGLLLGAEVPLVPRLHLMTDWIVGTNDESVATLGVMFMVTPHVQFCAGGFAGSFGSENKGGIVVEVNVLTWPDWPAGRQRSPH